MDITPEAEFDEDAGRGGEGSRQAQAKRLYHCKNTEDVKDGALKSAKPCKKVGELTEEERTHPRVVRIENRDQHGFQSTAIPVRRPLRWEVTDTRETWSDSW